MEYLESKLDLFDKILFKLFIKHLPTTLVVELIAVIVLFISVAIKADTGS